MKEHHENVECRFDLYCKRVLRNELIDAVREYQRRAAQEIAFSELSDREKQQLQYIDHYHPDRRIFSVCGLDIEIIDSDLVGALSALPRERLEIILLAYLFGLSDADIARIMKLRRSTVQYQRTNTLKLLQQLLREKPP